MHLGTTVTQHLLESQDTAPRATGAFTRLLNEMIVAAKIIAREINKAGLAELLSLAGHSEPHGEQIRKLDVFARDTIIARVQSSGELCLMATADTPDPIKIPRQYKKGNYVVYFDPIDSSSNLESNISVGTIFSIYKRVSEGSGDGTFEDVLQPGVKQAAAGYFLYGSSTVMVYTAGDGVHMFNLEPSVGEFLLSYDNIKLPDKGYIYSVNESNYNYWDAGVRRYIDSLKEIPESGPKKYTSRYMGDLVADVHRILLNGGIFLYPANVIEAHKKKGKLKLMSEVNPLAMIIEQAGGKASNGEERILDIVPDGIHQRVPLIIGSKDDVALAEEFFQGKRIGT